MDVLLQVLEDVEGLRLAWVKERVLLFMLNALVITTTITDTIRTPHETQSAPIILPRGVFGE